MTRTFSFSSGFKTLDDIDDFNRDYEPRPLSRAIALMLIATVLMGIQAGRLVYLQLINGVENRQKAESNRIRLIPIPANRGVIIDRKGKPLAANRMSRSVYAWPKEQTMKQWEITANRLAPVLNIAPSTILTKVEKAINQGESNIILSRQITPQAFVLLNERFKDFPGVEVRAESVRYYPQGDSAAHLLGYIGEVTKEELDKNPDYRLHMMVGKLGIEASANNILAGQWGDHLIEVNSMSQDVRELGIQQPKDGQTVQMTLDIDLQKAAETALGQRLGAVVVLDVKTGGVLAMASYPRFNPNMFTKPLTEKEWASLQTPENPLLNRALQGYPPGSTFKVVTTAAALGSGKYSVYDVIGTSSAIQVGELTFNEHSGALGYIGFRDALAFSSNTFFYQIGLNIGPQEIYKWAHNLGLGGDDLELLGLKATYNGLIPTVKDKKEIYGDDWYAGDTVNMSIGQGLVLATPLELAAMMATVANDGKRVKPHLFVDPDKKIDLKPVPSGMSQEKVRIIQEGLTDVVAYGTAKDLGDGSIPLTAGKTGTSEMFGQRDHSLYVAYGPADKPAIAIAVIVENGGYGSESAAPIAKYIFQTYFKLLKNGK